MPELIAIFSLLHRFSLPAVRRAARGWRAAVLSAGLATGWATGLATVLAAGCLAGASVAGMGVASAAAVASAPMPGPAAAAPPASVAPPARWSTMSDTLFRQYDMFEAAGGTAFAQDDSGFIWLGTQSGLLRWDGYRMRRYAADVRQPGALPDSMIVCLLTDSAKRLWIGTNAGLARYDATRDAFVRVGDGPDGLSDARIMALASDGAGGLWVGTGVGLDHVDGAGKVRRISDASLPAHLLEMGGVEALLAEPDGAMWLGTRRGLVRRAGAGAPWLAVALPTAEHDAAVLRLFRDSAGRVWVGSRTHGAFVAEPGSLDMQPVRESGASPALQGERVMSIIEAAPQQVWLGTEGGGIVAVDARSGITRRIQRHPDTPNSLHDNDVTAMFRERSGLVFVATTLAMGVHDPQQRAVLSLLGVGGESGRNPSITTLLAMPGGRFWLGVGGGGIDIIDPQLGLVGRLRPDASGSPATLPRGRVTSLVAGPGDSVYIGTQQGLYRSDASGRHVERLRLQGRSDIEAVSALSYDGTLLWMGGADGLWSLDVSGASARVLRHSTELHGDRLVTALQPAPGGGLWVGTRAGLVFQAPDGTLRRLPTDQADPSRAPLGYVSSLLYDDHGRLWMSSYGNGVALLERRDGAGRDWFRRIGLAEGMPDAGANTLLKDRHGMLWVSTDNGLVRIDPDTYALLPLQQRDGVAVQSYWTNSGAVSDRGELLFGGQAGLTVVRPELLKRWTYGAPLVLTEGALGERSTAVTRFNNGAGKGTAVAPLELPAGERALWVEFAALDYSSPQHNRYAYRLKGFDTNWISTEPRYRRASYNNLAPGDYTLELRGSNREGAWSAPLTVPVRVLPAWYQTWWWGLTVLVALLLLVAALVQGRTRYLRRRQHELQELVAVRTAELRATQRQLEQLAYADPLTGLPNRRLFNDELRQCVAVGERDGRPFVLLLIDLDHFKQINDRLGHDAGDALLVEVAQRLRLAVRDADSVARLGGDEFAVLLRQADSAGGVDAICQRIVDSLAEAVPFQATTMQISSSIGAAGYPRDGADPDALYKAADVALYDAKRGGRSTWRWYAA